MLGFAASSCNLVGPGGPPDSPLSGASWQLSQLALSSSTASIGGELGAVALTLVDTLVFAADLLGCSAGSADGGSIAKVAVDADEVGGHTEGADVLDDDLAGALGLVVGAVAAGAVELAGVDNGVVADSDGTNTVVSRYWS